MKQEKMYDYCLRCGRKLKNQKAKELGYGMVCYKKLTTPRHIKPLFEPKR